MDSQKARLVHLELSVRNEIGNKSFLNKYIIKGMNELHDGMNEGRTQGSKQGRKDEGNLINI